MSVVKYLKKQEWSMGNGQCPECCGVSPDWIGHPLHLDGNTIGHENGCQLAQSLASLGVEPLMKGDFISDTVYECYITEDGFFSTRPKTKDGCPKIAAENKKIEEKLFDILDSCFQGEF